MQRIIKANDVDAAFREEGYGEEVSQLVQGNKSFKATRSLQQTNDTPSSPGQADKMSHGQDAE